VSLKSLLKHHPSGCQLARPARPTGPTPIVSLSSGPTSPRACAAARPGLMSRATPPHCAPPPHCAAHPGTSKSRFR
jgi:hypothetical protein